MNNKEKFLTLVSKDKTDSLAKNKERIKNRARLGESQQIAIKVLSKLDELGWTQTKLAQELGVTPQQVNKIVSGKENMTIETMKKIQDILDIPVFATYYEHKLKNLNESIIKIEKRVTHFSAVLNKAVVREYEKATPVKKVGGKQLTNERYEMSAQ